MNFDVKGMGLGLPFSVSSDMRMKAYKAPWGTALRIVSFTLVVLSVASVVGWPLVFPAEAGSVVLLLQWSLPVILACCLPFVIRGYAITSDAVLIRRLFWTTRLDLSGLISAEALPKAMTKCLRVCGNGGVFSFTGWYWSKSLGFFRPLVTDLNRTVVLRFGKRTVVISPDDPEGFVIELERR